MHRIQLIIPAICAVMVVLWIMAGGANFKIANSWVWCISLPSLLTLLATVLLTFNVILSTRWVWLSEWIGGLGERSKLGKWLDITAMVLFILYLTLMACLDFANGSSVPTTLLPQTYLLYQLEQFYPICWSLLPGLVLVTLWIMIFLGVMALYQSSSQRFYIISHCLRLGVFLLLSYYTTVCMPTRWWGESIGLVMILWLCTGIVAWLDLVFGVSQRMHRVAAVIETLQYHHGSEILEVNMRTLGIWPGHRIGQFAFVAFDLKQPSYPFILANPWQQDDCLRFMIKGACNYTRSLSDTLMEGKEIYVEGPYGSFEFNSAEGQIEPLQVWVAEGMGITPFIARAQRLTESSKQGDVFLFYLVDELDVEFLETIKALMAEAHVQLHIVDGHQKEDLTGSFIIDKIPYWIKASWLLCGSAQLGRRLYRELTARGVPSKKIQQQLLELS